MKADSRGAGVFLTAFAGPRSAGGLVALGRLARVRVQGS